MKGGKMISQRLFLCSQLEWLFGEVSVAVVTVANLTRGGDFGNLVRCNPREIETMAVRKKTPRDTSTQRAKGRLQISAPVTPSASPSVSAPRRTSRDLQRRRLIDACISALHVHGPSKTTVERVTAIARMSPGIVRFYFTSKAAMLVASLQFLADEFEQQLLIPVSRLKADPEAALRLLVDLYLDPQIASPRKVSVWYSFWGEASSRAEYFDLCGQKDANFTALTLDLIGRMIALTGQRQLNPDAVALGLIGVLEVLWQDIAFQDESQIDRPLVKRRAMNYLRSVFPGRFDAGHGARASHDPVSRPAASVPGVWQLAGHIAQLPTSDSVLTVRFGSSRADIQRDTAGLTARISPDSAQRIKSGTLIEVCERDGFIFLLASTAALD